MATRIVIHHLGGSKVNQVEQFLLDSFSELTIGREPGMTISFDTLRDETVSRRHAIIKVEAGDPPRFKLSDLGSSNGTLVNGQQIVGETELLPGDAVELGTGGPKFTFDIDPRPMLPARTRVIGAGPSTATRMIGSDEGIRHPAMLPPTDVIRPSIGRNTVMRLLNEQKHSHARIGMYALAGVLAVVGVVGAALFHKSHHDAAVAMENSNKIVDIVNSKDVALSEEINKERAANGVSPQAVAEQYSNATVLVSMQWRLYDRVTGKPLFHKTFAYNGQLLPAYVLMKNGQVYRWLTTEDEGHSNFHVGEEAQGTGFVVNEQGLIFTNKHVAAAWKINYRQFSQYEKGQGLLFDEQEHFKTLKDYVKKERKDFRSDKEYKQYLSDVDQQYHDDMNHFGQKFGTLLGNLSNPRFQKLVSWQPEEGGPVFVNDQPVAVDNNDHTFEGRDDELSVRFPGSRVDVTARLVRASSDADAALIKIDPTEKLSAVPIAKDDTVNLGEHVICLGYPAFSEETVAVFSTRENGETRTQREVIPQPTVTSGIISNISQPTQQAGNVTIVSTTGDVYQMSLASGAGNSGGPVFDGKGQVIGLFTYGNRDNNTVTYAVPIKYARDLMQMQKL